MPHGPLLPLSLSALCLAASASVSFAASEPGDLLVFCVNSPRSEGAAAEQLNAKVRTARVAVRSEALCRPTEPRTYLARFQASGMSVSLVIQPAGGARLERVVPWLSHPGNALEALADQARLEQLSVLIEGLLAEHRARAALTIPRPAPPRTQAPVSAEAPASRRTAAPFSEVAQRASEVEAQRDRSPESPAPPDAAVAGAASARALEEHAPALAPPAPSLPGAPADVDAVAPEPAAPAAEQVAPPAPSPPVLAAMEPAAEPAEASSGEQGHLAASALAQLIVRTPGFTSLGLGANLAWKPFFLAASYVLAGQWSLGDRPIGTRGYSAVGGWQPLLWTRGPLGLSATVGLEIDRFELRRADLANAVYHSQVDAGLSIGSEVAYALPAGLSVTAQLAGSWFPTAHLVQIDGGPSTRFNGVGLGASVRFGWSN